MPRLPCKDVGPPWQDPQRPAQNKPLFPAQILQGQDLTRGTGLALLHRYFSTRQNFCQQHKKKMLTCQMPSRKRGLVLGQGEKEHSDLLGAPPWVYFNCFL